MNTKSTLLDIAQGLAGIKFIAIDVETANAKRNTICSIGLAIVENGEITRNKQFLIKPPTENFSNSFVHGIKAKDVADARTLEEVWPRIKEIIGSNLLVAHNASFDMDCITKSLQEYNIEPLENSYACTIKSCQKVLPKQDSYRLPELAKALEIELDHHNSASDAMACAQLALATLPKLNYQELFYMPQKEVTSNIKKLKGEPTNMIDNTRGHGMPAGAAAKKIKKSDVPFDLEHADENSPFYNKKVLFTGDLDRFSRLEAAQHAQKMGADVVGSISARTNIIVMGSSPGPAKIKKIEDLQNAGVEIRIIKEDEFAQMIK